MAVLNPPRKFSFNNVQFMAAWTQHVAAAGRWLSQSGSRTFGRPSHGGHKLGRLGHVGGHTLGRLRHILDALDRVAATLSDALVIAVATILAASLLATTTLLAEDLAGQLLEDTAAAKLTWNKNKRLK